MYVENGGEMALEPLLVQRVSCEGLTNTSKQSLLGRSEKALRSVSEVSFLEC